MDMIFLFPFHVSFQIFFFVMLLKRSRRSLYKACLRQDYEAIRYLIYNGYITRLDFPCFCNRFLPRGETGHSFLNHVLNERDGWSTFKYICYLCQQKNVTIVTTEMFWDNLLSDKLLETISLLGEEGRDSVCCKSLVRLLTLIVDWKSGEVEQQCWKAIESYHSKVAIFLNDSIGKDVGSIVMSYLGKVYYEPEPTEELSEETKLKYALRLKWRLSQLRPNGGTFSIFGRQQLDGRHQSILWGLLRTFYPHDSNTIFIPTEQ